MEFFDILGISPTEDKELIKKAYMEKLPQYHPEEDPEGFQKLRNAYDEALRYKVEEEQEDTTETGLWVKKAVAIYEDFEKRLSLDTWKALLEDEVCFSLDTAEEANEKLLAYLMNHYYVPHEVWAILQEHFGWEEKKQELYDKFPVNFIDYICANAKYEDSFRYFIFDIEPGKDYETFIRNYFYLLNNIHQEEAPDKEEKMQENIALGIDHPDFTILQVRYALQQKDHPLALSLSEDLLLKRPDDIHTLYCISQVSLATENYDRAREYAEKILEQIPDHVGGMIAIGECYHRQEKLEEALETYKKAIEIAPYDNYIMQTIYSIHDGLVTYYEKCLEEDPDNSELKLKLMESASECQQVQKTIDMKDHIDLSQMETSDIYRFYKTLGHAFGAVNNQEEAISHLQEALKICPDEEKETADLYADIGLEHLNADRIDEALAIYEQGLEKYPGFIRLQYRKAAALIAKKEYPQAVQLCDEVLNKEAVPNAYHFKAEALYYLNEYDESLENCDLALNLIPYYATYIIKLNIFERTNRPNYVADLTDYLIKIRWDRTEIHLYRLRALIAMRQYEEAQTEGLSILENEPNNQEALYQMAVVCRYEEKYEESLEYLNKMDDEHHHLDYQFLIAFVYEKLSKFDESEKVYRQLLENDEVEKDFVYGRLGVLFSRKKEFQQAEENYKKALELNPSHHYANGELADLYDEQDLQEKALEFNQKQLDIAPSDYFYIQRGIFLEKNKDYDSSIEQYEKAAEYNPNNYYSYNNIGLCYIKKGMPEEAISFYQKAIELGYPYTNAHFNLGLCLARLKRTEEALACYNEALEKFKDVHIFHFRKAILYYNLEEFDKAIACYQDYIKSNPEDKMDGLIRIGRCHSRMKRYDKAKMFFKQAMREQKHDYEPLEELGDLNYDLEKYRTAVSYYKKAIRTDKAGGFSYIGLGKSYEKLNKKDLAREAYQKALTAYLKELEEDNPVACDYQNIGTAYAYLGEKEKAMEFFQKAIDLAVYYKFCGCLDCYEAYYEIGKLMEKDQQLDTALENYEKAYKSSGKSKYKESYDELKEKMGN